MNPKVGVSVGKPTLDAGDVAAPDLSQAPRLSLEQWQSARSPSGNVLAWGCFRGDTTEWSADASELAFGKLAEIASGTAARMHGSSTPMHRVADRGNERALVGDAFADARARTFIVFTLGEVHACFVTCVDSSCASAVDLAEVTATGTPLVPAPPPGALLRSLGFVVHHPHGALGGLALSLVFAAAIAIGTRRHNRFPRQN